MTFKAHSIIALLYALLFSGIVFGQSAEPVQPTELELKEAAEEWAGEAWRRDDRDIERQVFRESLEQFLKRRDRASTARRHYDAARLAKVEAQLKEAQREVASLEQILASGIAAHNDEIERTVSRQLERLTEREMTIRQNVGKHEPGISPERQLLIDEQRQKELEQVAALREHLYRQKETLGRMREAKTPFIASVEGLLTHSRRISEALEEDLKRIKEETDLWQEYYAGLAAMARENAAAKQQKRIEDAEPKAPASEKPE